MGSTPMTEQLHAAVGRHGSVQRVAVLLKIDSKTLARILAGGRASLSTLELIKMKIAAGEV